MTYRPYKEITAKSLGDSYQNDSGVEMSKATPVRGDATGNVDFIDISVEVEAKAVIGVTKDVLSDGNQGEIISVGRVENITTTASFGDALYVSKTGGLTDVEPEVGVDGFASGDFAIRIGVVVKNLSNPALKDLILDLDIIGQI